MMLSTIIHVARTVFLLTVIGTGTYSQSNLGTSANFNDFINDNAILNNTTANDMGDASNDPLSSSPSVSSVASTGRDEDRLYRMRQRSRNHRLQSLRFQILQRLGMDQPPSVTVSPERRNRVMEALERFPALVDPLEQEELENTERRCYSASCDIPHKVNETLWRNASNLGLRLFVPVPRDRSNDAELQSATLHLFLKPNAMGRAQCDCDDDVAGESNDSNCHSVSGLLVQVYQYVRPLSIRRRGRVVNRRRLLDAKFVPVSGNTWISFNIRNVATDWRRHRRNFGVEVTIKDDNETEIDAKAMFVPPDCTVGREIGCREGSGNENEPDLRFPWLVNFRDNFPYVDLTAVRPGSSTSRPRRSLRPRRNWRHQKDTQRRRAEDLTTPRGQHAPPLPLPLSQASCVGESIVVPVTDVTVVEPKSYLSRVCPSTCWDCTRGRQCTSRPCLPHKTEPVVGRYQSAHGGRSEPVVLPFTRIVKCGC